MNRKLVFVSRSGKMIKEYEISKATKVKTNGKDFINIDKLKDDTIRFLWTQNMLDELSDVDYIKVVRDV